MSFSSMWLRAVPLAAALVLSGRAADLPTLALRPLEGAPPVVDGRLDDACWRRAPDMDRFWLAGANPPAPAPAGTEVWITRDDAWLFVAARCRDERAAALECRCLERDGSVNLDESLECFISPGTDGRSYFHFKVNASGTQGDSRMNSGQRADWDGHWRSAGGVEADTRSWTLELAIPLFYLADARGTERWRLNICRNLDGQKTIHAWAPLSAKNLHAPDEFGVLLGLENVNPAPVFAPVLTEARIGNMTDLPERGYEVLATLKNDGAAPGAVEAAAADVASAGERWLEPRRIELAPGHEADVTHWIVFDEYEPRRSRARISLRDALGVWSFTRTINWERAQEPFAAHMDRSYYTTESEHYLVYQSPLPAAFLETCRIRVTGDALREPVVAERPRIAGRIRLPLAHEGIGRWPVQAALERGDGQVLKTVTCEIVRRDANPAGNTIKIDRWRRCAILNDAPFFPYGFIGAPSDGLELMAGVGANAAVLWDRSAPDVLMKTLDRARDHGIYLVTSARPDVRVMGHTQTEETMGRMLAGTLDGLPKWLASLARHPALLAYHLMDEPFNTPLVRDTLWTIYTNLHLLDGYHPVFPGDPHPLLSSDPIWNGMTDIGFVHRYWVPQGGQRVPRNVLAGWREVRQASRDQMKPIWYVTVNEFHSLSSRPLTPDERRLTVYLALIHEFTGLFYFVWPAAHEASHAVLRDLKREVDALAPALLTRTPEQSFTVTGGDPDMVQALWKEHPEGGGLLLAANTLNLPLDVTFQVDGLPNGAPVSPLFADRPADTVKDGGWTERFEPYGVRVYRLPAPAAEPEAPLAIRAVIPKGEVVVAALSAVEASPNRVVNPGFESDGGWTGLDPDGGAALDDQRACTGARSLRLARANADAPTLTVLSAPLELEPNARYRVAAWVYGEIESGPDRWGGVAISVQSQTRKDYRLNMRTHIKQIQRTWQDRGEYLETGPEPETIRVAVTAPRGSFTGTVWVDDVRVQKVERRESRNLLPNSGFEHATLPGYPDRWTAGVSTRWLAPDTLTPRPNALVRQDPAEKVEGACSLRLRGYIWLNSAPTRWNTGVRLKADAEYVFSVYLKADRPDYEIRFNAAGGPRELVKVGTTWTRYHWPVRPSADQTSLHVTLLPIGSMRYDGPAESMPVLWVDAAQFEEGTEPTEYVPDAYHLDTTAPMSSP